jgi:SM-20-related protein
MNCNLRKPAGRASAPPDHGAPDRGIASAGENLIIAAVTMAEAVLSLLDLDRLRASPLCRDPFDFVVVEEFVRPEHLSAIVGDFPALGQHGSFPLNGQPCGAAFARLAAELEGDALRRAVAAKFAIDLEGRPTMITLRGYSDGKDGRIHTDSATKLITLLLYMNPAWEEAAGRLRLLRRADDLDDFVAEIPPVAGTMVAFRRTANSFHGHHAHIGARRSIQLNWVTDAAVVRRELLRHRWSARLKSLNPFA